MIDNTDAASVIITMIALIMLTIQQAFLISSPICLPMVDATLIAMVVTVIVATMIVAIIR